MGDAATQRHRADADMCWMPAATFAMGSDHHYPEEAPAHVVTRRRLSGWIATPSPIASFERFVDATGYVTLAERPVDPAHYPGAQARAARPVVGRLRESRTAAWICATPTTGGRTSRAPTGGTRAGRAARCRACGTTPSCTSRSRTPKRTRTGPAKSCRRRPSGSSPHAAASRAPSSSGATSSRRTARRIANTWQGEFPWQNTQGRRLRVDGAGRLVSAERLRPLRDGRQRLGVDDGLVSRSTTRMPNRVLRAAATREAASSRTASIRAQPRSRFRARS